MHPFVSKLKTKDSIMLPLADESDWDSDIESVRDGAMILRTRSGPSGISSDGKFK